MVFRKSRGIGNIDKYDLYTAYIGSNLSNAYDMHCLDIPIIWVVFV